MRDPSELVWINVENESFWWEAAITGIRFESRTDPDSRTEYSIQEGSTALTDTGSSCTYIPAQYYSEFTSQFMAKTDSSVFVDIYGFLELECSAIDQLPIISFLYGGYWMESRPEDYTVNYEGQCWACFISSDDESQWLLGDSFLRGFYSTHDHAEYRFGFAPHATSKKSAPQPGETPETEMPASKASTDSDSGASDEFYGYDSYYGGYGSYYGGYDYYYYSGYDYYYYGGYGSYYGYYYGGYYYNQPPPKDDGWGLKPGHIAGAIVIATSVGMIIYGVIAAN